MLGTTCRTAAFQGEQRAPTLSFFDSIVGGVVSGIFGGGKQEEKKEKAPPKPEVMLYGGAPLGVWAFGAAGVALLIFLIRGPKA